MEKEFQSTDPIITLAVYAFILMVLSPYILFYLFSGNLMAIALFLLLIAAMAYGVLIIESYVIGEEEMKALDVFGKTKWGIPYSGIKEITFGEKYSYPYFIFPKTKIAIYSSSGVRRIMFSYLKKGDATSFLDAMREKIGKENVWHEKEFRKRMVKKIKEKHPDIETEHPELIAKIRGKE